MQIFNKIVASSSILFSSILVSALIPVSANSEYDGTFIFENPKWQIMSYGTCIDTNSISKNGSLVVYDTCDEHGGYARLNANCQTMKVRTIRRGGFLSSTKVQYIDYVRRGISQWGTPSGVVALEAYKIACR